MSTNPYPDPDPKAGMVIGDLLDERANLSMMRELNDAGASDDDFVLLMEERPPTQHAPLIGPPPLLSPPSGNRVGK